MENETSAAEAVPLSKAWILQENMSPEECDLLKNSVDRVVAIELETGEQFFAEIVIVVDEPPTPDVFLLRVEREPDGAFVAKTAAGESFLLSEIRRVAAIPGIPP